MSSNEDHSTDGKSSHRNTRSKGSMCTVKVGSRSFPLYPLVVVCLGLLDIILLLTAVVIGINCGKVSEEPAPQRTIAQTLIIEMKQLQIINGEAIEAQKETEQAIEKELRKHQELKLQLEQNKSLSDGFQRQIEILEVEKATLQSTFSEMKESCGRCPPGWLYLNTSCYFHGKSQSVPLKTWRASREDCISRGADLVVIDNWKKQVLLLDYLPKLGLGMPMSQRRFKDIWIGLTDIQTEGTWVWVNNVTLDEGYWMPGQPDNSGIEGEDCAALRTTHGSRDTWLDENCRLTLDWLCEMAPS